MLLQNSVAWVWVDKGMATLLCGAEARKTLRTRVDSRGQA